jgi:hypothetical protein
MNKPPTTLELRSAPLLHTPRTVEQIMRHVVYALLPLCAFAVYAFGLSAAALIGVVTVSCVGTEQLFNRLAGRVSTLADNSAVITGLLLALTLPPGFPLPALSPLALARRCSVDWGETSSTRRWSGARLCRRHFRWPLPPGMPRS